ncbi:chaperone protein dnaJ C76, chloroplastic-like [Cynara cardunculus var. scolymus]|uniref:chaperone protein dnaJ C76, chloroplastic-like n=1 Tax=Cynara cardunculus var. scolymus TaxID=59895 RepID=UPI000D62527F|nr:chaperone protein dnaJ C76, chloroplastic-like [Cynara cardunculus var. scolymus]
MAAFAIFRLPEVLNPPTTTVHHRSKLDHPNHPISRWRSKCRCMQNPGEIRRTKSQNYYELLGISVDSNPPKIKESYRKLQKKYHPDIAGHQGHEHTLLLNEAYTVLMKDELRKNYDASIGHVRVGFGGDALNMGYSSWNGPLRPQALFVDEKACIGCRECVHNASNTFVMDETIGCARVNVQFGDDDTSIEIAVQSCPLNCIHWVERDEIAVLEYLNKPQEKKGYGVFGQGWERPANVFMAAKTFEKQLKQKQAESQRNHARHDVEQETAAQAEARESASLKLKMERFSGFWEWMKGIVAKKEVPS